MNNILDYFNKNKNEILSFINKEIYIFPKMLLNTEDLFDNDLYFTLQNQNNIFSYFFKIENTKIFSIKRENKEKFFFKSDFKYKNLYLFFSDNHLVNVNNKLIKDENLLTNSDDEVYIKNGDFLIISFLESEILDYDIFLIPYKEKNIFDKIKINKINIKNIFINKMFKL